MNTFCTDIKIHPVFLLRQPEPVLALQISANMSPIPAGPALLAQLQVAPC